VTAHDREDWSFATARVPARFTAAREMEADIWHATSGDNTLCGIPREQVVVFRSLFSAGRKEACPRCGEEALGAPTQPCVQERLLGEIQAAVPGPLREELAEALRKGADVTIWINGPAHLMAHYAKLDQIVGNGEPAAATLRTAQTAGVARVADRGGEFVVIVPAGGGRPTTIARAAR
jgi:hypothetical protein